MVFKKIIALSLFVVLMGVTAACSSSESDDYAIATVNDEEIMASEYYESVDRMVENYERQGMDFSSEQGAMFLAQIEQQAYTMLIQQAVLYQAAESEGLIATDDEVEDEIDAIRSSFPSEEDFEEALEMNGFTMSRFREMLLLDLSIENYFNAHMDEIEVTMDDIFHLYQEYEVEYEAQGEEMPTFSEVQDQLEAQLRQEAKDAQVSVILNELMEESTIEDLREAA